MLKKQNRLAKITRTKKDRLFTSPFFNLRVSDNQEEKIRFAFIVSKKIDKRAVIRNKTKRILRSLVEATIDKIRAGKDFVLVSKKKLEPEQKEVVFNSLQEIFKKAGVLKDE